MVTDDARASLVVARPDTLSAHVLQPARREPQICGRILGGEPGRRDWGICSNVLGDNFGDVVGQLVP